MKIPIEDWTTPDQLILIRGWARDGLTDEQIAQKIGISIRTLHRWKKHTVEKDGVKITPIANALKLGKEVIDDIVEEALLQNAKNGDTTAQIFWLKNRRPDKWRDRRSDQDQDNRRGSDIEDLSPLAELLNEPDTDD